MDAERSDRLAAPHPPAPHDAPAVGRDAGANPYTHIACCVDDSAASMLALAEARRLFALGPGRLSVVHVGWLPPDSGLSGASVVLEQFLRDAQAWLDAQVRPGESAVFLTTDPPPQAVCEWARTDGHPDLIVAASHRRFWERIELGSFATYLARHAPCSVLLVRPTPVPSEPTDPGPG